MIQKRIIQGFKKNITLFPFNIIYSYTINLGIYMGSNIFFGLFRRRGFTETMEVLNSFPNNEAVQSIFFEKLISVESYPNTYFRVKKDLLDHKLIGYKLNEKNEKVIFLTDKGKDIWSKVQEIESILISN